MNLREHFRQLRARHDGVLHDEVRRHAAHRAERLLASLPEARALDVVARDAHGSRAVRSAERLDRRDVDLETGERAVDLDEQRGRRVRRIAGRVDRRFHGANRRLIDHLERGRNDARRDDRRHGARRRVERHEVGEQRANRFRISRQSNGDVERDAKAALGADERADEIVAILLAVRAAERDDLAVGKQHGERDDVIRRHAVLEAVRTARVLGDVAADRARGLARRIRRVVQSVRGDRARQRDVHDARLDDREQILGVDRQNAIESVESDEHDAVGERTARQSGARATRNERQIALGELANDGDELVARAGKDRERRLLVVRRQRIRRVRQQLAGRCSTRRAPTISMRRSTSC